MQKLIMQSVPGPIVVLPSRHSPSVKERLTGADQWWDFDEISALGIKIVVNPN